MVCEICEQFAADGTLASAFAGGIIGALMIFGIITIILLFIGMYVYFSLAWYTIAKKLKHKNAWIMWIPIAKTALILELGGFHWAWIFLIFIPILGWVALIILTIISKWKIFEKRKYPGWFSLGIIIPQIGGIIHTIVLGFVAWKDRKKKLFD